MMDAIPFTPNLMKAISNNWNLTSAISVFDNRGPFLHWMLRILLRLKYDVVDVKLWVV